VFGREHPVDAGAAVVALVFPGGDLGNEACAAFDAAVEALARRTPISISTMLSQLACLGV
jgi:hypothetical protein